MSGTDIFLSYARHDRPMARIFAECLAEEGFNVWWDASLQAGETFDEVIEQRLRDAKAVVVLWSPRSVASRWVRAEATLADRRDKLAPAIIEACDLPIIFELKHAAELCDWAGDTADLRWRRFVEDLRRLVDVTGAAAVSPQPAAANGAGHAPSRAQPASRTPLRPGHDEVIHTATTRRPAALHSVEPPMEPTADDDADREVHCLELEDDTLGEEPFVIESSAVKIGRTSPADVVIADKSISREHCIVGIANDELLVTDLNSTNGTYVDGERIKRATVLPVGSVLRLGEVSLRHAVRSGAQVNHSLGRSTDRRLAAAS